MFTTFLLCRKSCKVGIKYFPNKKGTDLLFHKNNNGKTPFQLAGERFGHDEVMEVIEDTLIIRYSGHTNHYCRGIGNVNYRWTYWFRWCTFPVTERTRCYTKTTIIRRMWRWGRRWIVLLIKPTVVIHKRENGREELKKPWIATTTMKYKDVIVCYSFSIEKSYAIFL